MKKILLSVSAVALAVASVPMFAAFEAHVINVTARIENALRVNTEPIHYGTVFPQEQLDKQVQLALSQSFLDEGRVDDVHYVIRQKPKCAITRNNGQEFDPTNTGTGEPKLDPVDRPFIDCGPPPRATTTGETWGPLPLLCPYLSKHPIPTIPNENNDGSLPAFHQIGQFVGHQWVWNEVDGNMSKILGDILDQWNIDLKVPCFRGHCAQDWEKFVADINPNAATSTDLYVADPLDEHKIFGCNLWFEVRGISLPPVPEPTPGGNG